MQNSLKNFVKNGIMSNTVLIISTLLIVLLFLPNQTLSGTQRMLAKIMIQNENDLNVLQNMGLEPLIIEKDYVIIRINKEKKVQIEDAGFVAVTPQEEDLVLRLIKIPVSMKSAPETISSLHTMGLDIWETREDYIIALAFDKQIKQLKNSGFSVEVLYSNSRDFVEQKKN